LPAMNWPPPREKVTMMGPPAFLAASMHALIEPVPRKIYLKHVSEQHAEIVGIYEYKTAS